MGRWIGNGIVRNWFSQHRPRGAAVPFEAPALRMARVCDDERDGLIAILRDFANNGTAYIVPWKSLPLIASMTEHDLAIHEAVRENQASTPAQVRAVISKLARSGVLGSEAKAREGERFLTEQSRLADVELILILHLLDSCGADLSKLIANPVHWRDTEAKSAISTAAKTIEVKRQDIYRRISEFAMLLAPVGLISSQGTSQSGWLRVLHDEIAAFGEEMAAASRSGSPDVAVHLAAIAETAARNSQLSGTVLGMLDYAVLDIGGTMRRWSSELPVLRQAIDRLSLMLDEWPSLIKMAHDALREPTDKAIEQLRVLRSMLPRFPEPEPISGDSPESNDANVPSVSGALGERLQAIRSMLSVSRPVER